MRGEGQEVPPLRDLFRDQLSEVACDQPPATILGRKGRGLKDSPASPEPKPIREGYLLLATRTSSATLKTPDLMKLSSR